MVDKYYEAEGSTSSSAMQPRYPSNEGLQFTPNGARIYDSTPEFVQPEKHVVSMTQLDNPSMSKDKQERRICYARQRNFWIIFASVSAAVILAVLFGIIGHLVAEVNSNKSSAAAPTSSPSSQSIGVLSATTLVSPTSTFAVTTTDSSTPISVTTVTPTSIQRTSSSTVSATRSSSTLSCGAIAKCDATGCNGFNSQETTYGQCQAGTEKGCPCITLCGPILGPCTGCGGLNGTCVDLPYAGCGCT